MSLGFPTTGLTANVTTYTVNGRTWLWNGKGWQLRSTFVGYTGSMGYWGSVGYFGSSGYTGSAGIGYTGSNGYFGSVGYSGSIGNPGYTGSNGYWGSVGYWGSTGYAGSIGTEAVVYISTTPPSSAFAGKFWYKSDEAALYVYYVDVDSSQWVSITAAGSTGYTGSGGVVLSFLLFFETVMLSVAEIL